MPVKVYAVGRNDVYEPYLQRDGTYALYSPERQQLTAKPIHHAANKHEGVTSLEQAVRLVRKRQFHWRLEGRAKGEKNVFAPECIVVEEPQSRGPA